jgi:hypothetical protein
MDITKHGEFCVDEKNSNYAIKTESGPGPITLSFGESFSAVAVKQATGCYYQLAPTSDGPENGVYLDVNGVEECIFVTRSTNGQTGEYSYTFEVASEEGGCGISHVVGYFDPNIDETPPSTPPSTPPNNTPPGDTPITTVVENFLIPVTGVDLGIQALLPAGGLLLVGISFVVKGLLGKNKK